MFLSIFAQICYKVITTLLSVVINVEASACRRDMELLQRAGTSCM